MRHPIPTDDVVLDEFGDIFGGQLHIGHGLHPLCEVVNGYEDVSVTGGRIRDYFSNDVDPPYRERPWRGQAIEFGRWSVLKIGIDLTLVALSDYLTTIGVHSGPVIPLSKDLLSQHVSIHVRPANSSVDLIHHFLGMLMREAQ